LYCFKKSRNNKRLERGKFPSYGGVPRSGGVVYGKTDNFLCGLPENHPVSYRCHPSIGGEFYVFKSFIRLPVLQQNSF
jgi:hypothetical protein